MHLNKAVKNTILSKIGLQDIMIWQDHDDYIFGEKIFDTYVSEEYHNSTRKETDEVYRLSEIVVIHKLSGTRIEYVISENYTGNKCEYKVQDVFIITLQNKRVKISNIDFSKQYFVTSEGKIPFSEIEKSSKVY